MEQVYLRYPEDPEAAIFYALALNEATDHADKTYARQLKAGAILEKVFAAQPNHPGVAHYIIHSYDFPPLALKGLTAARAYAANCALGPPRAPHALACLLHARVLAGVDPADTASLAASRAYAAANLQGAVTAGELHSMDFLTYAYLQTGQDAEAQRILEQRNAVQKFYTRFLPGERVRGHPGALCPGAGTLGGGRHAATRDHPVPRGRGPRLFRARLGGGPAEGIPGRPAGPHSSSPRSETRWPRPRMILGRSSRDPAPRRAAWVCAGRREAGGRGEPDALGGRSRGCEREAHRDGEPAFPDAGAPGRNRCLKCTSPRKPSRRSRRRCGLTRPASGRCTAPPRRPKGPGTRP